MRRKSIEKSIKLWILRGRSYEAPVYTSLQCGIQHLCWSRLLSIARCNGLTMRGFDTNSVAAEGQCKEGRMKSALMFANQSEEIVWNWDTNTNSTANCLKHAVFNCEFISYMPPRLPWCSAFSLHKCYSVSGSESETSMSIRLHHSEFLCGGFSVGGTSCSTRNKTFLVVQLRAWPWILSKLIQVVVYFKYVTSDISRTCAVA